jgi:crotonobetainyl-CoA:carnitine CoA-transferase CaiB-like acyl-CoA transferase
MSAKPPLHGIRVVDLSWLLPGPFCTNLLADLGADVIKVERPGDGDYARSLLPGLFRLVNRGKRSAVFDLQQPGDRERLLALAATADVFVEGFRPGVVDRLGVGYAQVRERNAAIVYVSLSGYGQTGPRAAHPAHDINLCAQAGLLAIPSFVGQDRPYRMQLPVSDIAGAMYAALATLAALRQRDATGEGAHLDVSLEESALAWSSIRWCDAPADDDRRWMHVSPGNDIFRAADGVWLAFAIVEAKFWSAFRDAARGLGSAHDSERLAPSPPGADASREELQGQRDAIEAIVASHPSAAWLDAARVHDLPITKVATHLDEFAPDGLRGFPVQLPGMRRSADAPALGSDNTRLAAGPAAAWET